jgi:hypothetical protein
VALTAPVSLELAVVAFQVVAERRVSDAEFSASR